MKALWTLASTTAVVFFVLCGYVLLDTRKEFLRQTLDVNANLVHAISQDISRNFELYDLSLQGAIEALAEPELKLASPKIRQMALFDNAAKAMYLNRIVIIDTEGNVVEDSARSPALEGNFSDREYFRIHRDRADVGLYVSGPVESMTFPGEWIIVLSRRISRPDGSFGGIVFGSLNVAYFDALFANLKTSPRDAFAVIRSDGKMITRHPFLLRAIGIDASKSKLYQLFPSMRSGSYEDTAVTDGERRVVSFEQVGNLPLLVTVAVSSAAIFAAWLHKVLLIGALMVGLGVVMAALAFCFVRELHRRMVAERKLEAAAVSAAAAAATDALTGLANRRCLDDTAEIEWKRSVRNGEPISVLVIDVDFFKSYNDTFGHAGGDEVLQLISYCIRSTLKRPSDFAARYGGEEFVLLLPETPGYGARTIAENVRAAVAECNILHPGGVNEIISVSIGVATVSPRGGDFFATAFQAADAALYRAKRLGRDRVEHSDVTSISDVAA